MILRVVHEFLSCAGEADLQFLDLAEPAFSLGLGDAGDQVVADLGQPCRWAGSGRRSEHLTQAALNCGAGPSQSL